jgi:hypothetical protein
LILIQILDFQVFGFFVSFHIGSFQKTSIPPPQRKWEVNPPTPFGCPNTFTIIRNNFFSPPPPDGRNVLRGGSMDLFWNDPFSQFKTGTLYLQCVVLKFQFFCGRCWLYNIMICR